MPDTIQILLVEDSEDFTQLLREKLAAGELGFALQRTDNELALRAALTEKSWDIAICDFCLPGFTGLDVIRMVKAAHPFLPCIMVSGVVGEDITIDAVKAGASDFVAKSNLDRLLPAVQRTLREAELKKHAAQTQAALEESRTRLQAFFDNTLDAILIVDDAGRLLDTNPAAEALLGYTRVELLGRTLCEITVPENREQLEALWEKFLCQQSLTGEQVIMTRNGVKRHVEFSAKANILPGRHLASLRDITQRKWSESALRQTEERFSKVFHRCPFGVTIKSFREGRIIEVNDAFLALSGFTREEVIGKTTAELNLWADPSERPKTLQKLIENPAAYSYEHKLTKKSGGVCPVQASGELIDLAGETCVLTFFQDLTDQRRLEKELLQATKMESIGQLAGGIAHDFNNLLTVIYSNASLLRSDRALPLPLADAVDQIRIAAERASNLTRQLLTFSRKHIAQPKALDLNQAVADALKMLRRILGENVSLKFSPQSTPVIVLADTVMIEQTLMNLAVNARDALPKGGTIHVEISARALDTAYVHTRPQARIGRFVCLTVRDNGCGIPSEHLPHIFEPFFTTKEVGKGTGLGLSTVYGIVQQHNGWVEVESEVGKGTAFHIFLPESDRALVTNGAATAVTELREQQGSETILVVEDEPSVRALFVDLLMHKGYKVIEAENAVAALELQATRSADIDLVLTDVVMPQGMTGLELATVMRNQRPGMKVVFTSGYSADLAGLNLNELDQMHFLPKPFQPQQLFHAVRKALDAA